MKYNMKRLLALLLAVVMVFSFAACKATEKAGTSSDATASNATDDGLGNEETENNNITDDGTENVTDGSEDGIEFSEPEEEQEPEELPGADDDVIYEELTVKNGSKLVNDKFLGVNGVHMGFAFMPDKYGNRTPLQPWQQKAEYDRIADTMGVKQIRTFYSSSIAWDFNTNKLEWDVNKNAYLSGFYDSLKAWQDRDVEVAMSAHWSLAAFIGTAHTADGAGSFAGHGWYVANDLDTTLKNYRNFMKQTVLSLEANGIHNVKYLTAFTEGNNTYGGGGIAQRKYDEVCALYAKAVTALDGGLKDAGLRNSYKIVGPCDNYRLDWEYNDPEQYSIMTEYTLKKLSDKVDIIGSHIYSRCNEYIEDNYYNNIETTMGKTYNMVAKSGKDFWVDEFNARINEEDSNTVEMSRASLKNPARGVALAASVNGIMNAGISNVFIWSMADMQWSDNTSVNNEFDTGLQIGGYMPSPLESMTPYYNWYALSMLTRYIGQGKVYQTELGLGLYCSAIQRTDGEYTVVVTNYNLMDTPVHVSFEKSMGGKNFYRHLYDMNNVVPTEDAEIIEASAKAKNVTTGFYDTLPGYSVAVYTTVAD